MNERARWPAVVFAACTLGAVAALCLVTVHALRLERREMEARAQAAAEELARLALWRMDSALAPVIARESGRPYFHWSPFYPAGRAYTTMWEEVRPGEVLVPSPLLTFSDPLVRLHFQLTADGRLTSPQAPMGDMRGLVESAYLPAERVVEAEERLSRLRAMLGEPEKTFAAACVTLPPPEVSVVARVSDAEAGVRNVGQMFQQQAVEQEELAKNEYRARRSVSNIAKAAEQRALGPEADSAFSDPPAQGQARDTVAVHPETQVECGDMTAVWRTDGAEPALLLLRTVRAGGTVTVQGVWLDWERVRVWLLGLIADIMPEANLRPLEEGEADAAVGPGAGGERWLAAIPAALETGGPSAVVMPAWTPMRTTLALSWAAVLGAAAISAMVLRAARELAERRGRFVSAVTHELRTPMTTFRLYTQMLEEGMVADESARREYLGVLRREADRLAGIVETVLEFARLGRRRPAAAPPVSVAEALAEFLPALERRAAAGGMTLAVDAPEGELAGVRIAADTQALGQILHNLVENACKYAGPAAGGGEQLELTVRRAGPRITITVADHGPGIDPSVRRRLFRPFQRSASLDHAGVPGLGLGLALARGLARQMRGDLHLAATSPRGTAFTLTLPIAGG